MHEFRFDPVAMPAGTEALRSEVRAFIADEAARGAFTPSRNSWLHGAMGYTREHNPHYLTRRLWSWRDEFGNETLWQSHLGRMVAAQGADALWPRPSRL